MVELRDSDDNIEHLHLADEAGQEWLLQERAKPTTSAITRIRFKPSVKAPAVRTKKLRGEQLRNDDEEQLLLDAVVESLQSEKGSRGKKPVDEKSLRSSELSSGAAEGKDKSRPPLFRKRKIALKEKVTLKEAPSRKSCGAGSSSDSFPPLQTRRRGVSVMEPSMAQRSEVLKSLAMDYRIKLQEENQKKVEKKAERFGKAASRVTAGALVARSEASASRSQLCISKKERSANTRGR